MITDKKLVRTILPEGVFCLSPPLFNSVIIKSKGSAGTDKGEKTWHLWNSATSKKGVSDGRRCIEALQDVNFEVEKRGFCVVVGAFGRRKDHHFEYPGRMDTLSEGSVWLDGKEIFLYNKRQLTEYRRFDIGFVFQFYNLVQNLTALENVELAADL